MASECTVTFTLTDLGGDTDSDSVFSLFYRPSVNSLFASSGILYSKKWQRVDVTGAGTITLEQGRYYDFKMPFQRGEFSNKVCPATASTSLDALLDA